LLHIQARFISSIAGWKSFIATKIHATFPIPGGLIRDLQFVSWREMETDRTTKSTFPASRM
jgi:hypothetical protein